MKERNRDLIISDEAILMYSVVKKRATQTNAIGELKKLYLQGKFPIIVFDPEAELRYIIAIPEGDKK